jgi:hypothetical protein
MVEISGTFKEIINKPGRIGTISTADSAGRPNVAYFGSPRLQDDGTFVVALMATRTLKNLEVNPFAVFFCVEEGAVSFNSAGCRLYLKVKDIQKQGPLLEEMKAHVATAAGPDAAKMIAAAVAFEVTEARGLVDFS